MRHSSPYTPALSMPASCFRMGFNTYGYGRKSELLSRLRGGNLAAYVRNGTRLSHGCRFRSPTQEPAKAQGKGIGMTVTRPSSQDNGESRHVSPTVIRGIHAVRGLLLALAALITAVTGLVVALVRG
jgi:hypothetical protein